MNLVTVVNNLHQSFVCFDDLTVIQGDLLASSDGSDVIIIEKFPKTITEKVCGELNVPNFKNFGTGPITGSYLE